jgi:hypothetical protein
MAPDKKPNSQDLVSAKPTMYLHAHRQDGMTSLFVFQRGKEKGQAVVLYLPVGWVALIGRKKKTQRDTDICSC